eukprot:403355760
MLKIAVFLVVFFMKTFNAVELAKDENANATIAIIAGLMNGVTNSETNLEQLSECLKNNSDITELLSEIKEDISTKNINSMFEGMRLIGKLVVMLPPVLIKCENMTNEVNKFKDWAMVFTKPEELYNALVQNIPLHFTEMWTDIQDAIQYYQKKDYYNYGRDLGQTMVLAVGEAKDRSGIMNKLDMGYQKFKSWFDHYVMPKYEEAKDDVKTKYEDTKDSAKSLGEQIAESVKNINPMKWF